MQSFVKQLVTYLLQHQLLLYLDLSYRVNKRKRKPNATISIGPESRHRQHWEHKTQNECKQTKKPTITQITKMMSSTFTRRGRGLTCGIAQGLSLSKSSTVPHKITGVNPGVREGQAVPVSYRTSALLIIMLSIHSVVRVRGKKTSSCQWPWIFLAMNSTLCLFVNKSDKMETRKKTRCSRKVIRKYN